MQRKDIKPNISLRTSIAEETNNGMTKEKTSSTIKFTIIEFYKQKEKNSISLIIITITLIELKISMGKRLLSQLGKNLIKPQQTVLSQPKLSLPVLVSRSETIDFLNNQNFLT